MRFAYKIPLGAKVTIIGPFSGNPPTTELAASFLLDICRSSRASPERPKPVA
jgi:hypothetical protein